MLRSLNELQDYAIVATDGKLGAVHDFLFDDHSWIVRYLMDDTGTWLPGRRVLISPVSVQRADWAARELHLSLGKQQIESSPPIEADKPVSRQMEAELAGHYSWPYYWGAVVGGGSAAATELVKKKADQEESRPADPYLRSMKEVTGYHLRAADGDVGRVDDFIAEDETWTIRYLVIDTRRWLRGKKVLISPQWVDSIDWARSRFNIELLERKTIKESPEYEPAAPINREYEIRLYDFYGRPKYWEG
jgi:hypothetical protein